MEISVELKGGKELIKKLNKLSEMEQAEPIKWATAEILRNAKLYVPKDTGMLANSIHMDVTKEGKQIIGKVFTNNEYALYVEFGTGIKGNGSYPYKPKGVNLSYKQDWAGMVAQPYMFPALYSNLKSIKQILSIGYKQIIKENVK